MNVLSDSSNEANKINSNLEIENERKTYLTKGTSGLVNIGNTCYMNSTLQIMNATDLLIEYFIGRENMPAKYKADLKRGACRMIIENEKKKEKKMGIQTKEIELDENGQPKQIIYTINVNKMRKMFKNSLAYKYRNVACVMWGANRKVKPYGFKNKLGELNKEFRGFAQNDSQECLSLILDTIHEETKSEIEISIKPLDKQTEMVRQAKKKLEALKGKRAQYELIKFKNSYLKEFATIEALDFWKEYLSKNNSMIEHIFAGLFFGTIKCDECNNSSFKFEPFRIINLPLIMAKNRSDDITLEECLEEYFDNDEKLDGDCKYSCEICNHKTTAIKTTKIWYCPQRLIIHLKRFDNVMRKNNQKIVFPIEGLDMSSHTTQYVNGNHIYDLYGISYHTGSLKGGHYTAYTKNPINGEWYYYDDQHVLHVEKSKLESRLITPGAYILMYKLRNGTNLLNDDELSDDSVSVNTTDT